MLEAFIITNWIIAFGYAALAFFFGARVRLPREKRQGWRTIVALVFAAMFFVGCAHTHIDLAIWATQGELVHHWFSPLNVISHVLQGIGGLGFWIFASLWVQINIYDKKDYSRKRQEIEEDIQKRLSEKEADTQVDRSTTSLLD